MHKKYFNLTYQSNGDYTCFLYDNRVDTDYVSIDGAVYFILYKNYDSMFKLETLTLKRMSYEQLFGMSEEMVTDLIFQKENLPESFNLARAKTLIQGDKLFALKDMQLSEKETLLNYFKKLIYQ